jgi:hypothetical protein
MEINLYICKVKNIKHKMIRHYNFVGLLMKYYKISNQFIKQNSDIHFPLKLSLFFKIATDSFFVQKE